MWKGGGRERERRNKVILDYYLLVSLRPLWISRRRLLPYDPFFNCASSQSEPASDHLPGNEAEQFLSHADERGVGGGGKEGIQTTTINVRTRL